MPYQSCFGVMVSLSQVVTFTATLSGSGGTPTGSVTFYDGNSALGSATLDASGQASLNTSSLAQGPHTIRAGHGGDGIFAGSASAPLA